MELKLWQACLLFGAMTLILPRPVLGTDEEGDKVISNTAVVSYQTSGGATVLVESAPDGNSIPGEGRGKPVIVVVPKTNASDPDEEAGGD